MELFPQRIELSRVPFLTKLFYGISEIFPTQNCHRPRVGVKPPPGGAVGGCPADRRALPTER